MNKIIVFLATVVVSALATIGVMQLLIPDIVVNRHEGSINFEITSDGVATNKETPTDESSPEPTVEESSPTIEEDPSLIEDIANTTREPIYTEYLPATEEQVEPVLVEEPVVEVEENVEPEPTVEEVEPVVEEPKNLIQANHWVRLRAQPNTNSTILGQLDAWTTVEYVSYNNGWYQLSTGEYVFGQYVDVVQ